MTGVCLSPRPCSGQACGVHGCDSEATVVDREATSSAEVLLTRQGPSGRKEGPAQQTWLFGGRWGPGGFQPGGAGLPAVGGQQAGSGKFRSPWQGSASLSEGIYSWGESPQNSSPQTRLSACVCTCVCDPRICGFTSVSRGHVSGGGPAESHLEPQEVERSPSPLGSDTHPRQAVWLGESPCPLWA